MIFQIIFMSLSFVLFQYILLIHFNLIAITYYFRSTKAENLYINIIIKILDKRAENDKILEYLNKFVFLTTKLIDNEVKTIRVQNIINYNFINCGCVVIDLRQVIASSLPL